MTNFEIDVPSAKAARFDRAVDQFVRSELMFRPDVDIRVTKYSTEPGVEHRAIFVSSEAHMEVLVRRLHMAVSG